MKQGRSEAWKKMMGMKNQGRREKNGTVLLMLAGNQGERGSVLLIRKTPGTMVGPGGRDRMLAVKQNVKRKKILYIVGYYIKYNILV